MGTGGSNEGRRSGIEARGYSSRWSLSRPPVLQGLWRRETQCHFRNIYERWWGQGHGSSKFRNEGPTPHRFHQAIATAVEWFGFLCWCCAYLWCPVPALWTPNLNYPGEGPGVVSTPLNFPSGVMGSDAQWGPQHLRLGAQLEIEPIWVANARFRLAGDFPNRDRWTSLTDDEVHRALLVMCTTMNQNIPVAARLQSR